MKPDKPSTIHASYREDYACLNGYIEQRLRIMAEDLLHSLPQSPTQRSMDLLGIAASVYAIDRTYKRADDIHNESGVRTIPVEFEVSDHPFWSASGVADALTKLLCFLTGDIWLVRFTPRTDKHQMVPRQRKLRLSVPYPSHVALYSGGLDSAAGLANWLLDGREPPLLLTVNHQSSVQWSTRSQVKTLEALLHMPSPLSHASFVLHLEGGATERMRDQEQSQRGRGFLFCAVASLVAQGCGIGSIALFENGVGAVNLPLTEGGLMDGLSTRGTNPGFLAQAAELFSEVAEREVKFDLPFLHQTKAEMVARLVGEPSLVAWAQQSRSCVHSSLRVSGKRHCGTCAACLERRQAFRAAGASENIDDYEHDLFSGHSPIDAAYFYSYLDNAHGWKTSAPRVADRLAHHWALSSMASLGLPSAQALYERHADEVLLTYGDLVLGEPLPATREPDPQLELI